MPAIRFVFITWGFWALFDLRWAGYALAAVLCIVLSGAGGTMLYLGTDEGFGLLVLSWILYAAIGARFWTKLGSDIDQPFPKTLRAPF